MSLSAEVVLWSVKESYMLSRKISNNKSQEKLKSTRLL